MAADLQTVLPAFDPNYDPAQIALLQRQKMLGDALLKQGMGDPLQGQMVSGRYVAPSWTQQLAKGLQTFLGNRMGAEADTKIAQAQAQAMRNMFGQAMGGGQSPAPSMGTYSAPDGTQIGDTGSQSVPMPAAQPNQGAGGVIPGTNVPRQAALASMLWNSLNPEMGKTILAPYQLTDLQKNMTAMGQDPRLMGQLGIAEARKKGILELQPGTTALDLATGQERFQPQLEKGISLNNGVASEVPGYGQAAASLAGQTARATAAGNASQEMVTINTPNGPVMVTKEQAAQMAGGSPRPGVQFQNPNQAGASLNFQGMTPQQVAQMGASITNPDDRAKFNQALGAWANQGQSAQPGIALKSPATEAYENKLAADAGAYKGTLDDRVRQGADLNMRLQESVGALQKFRAGGGAETRAQLASLAQAIPGVSQDTVNKIAGGDLGAMQEFNKLATQQAMEQLKQAMGGAGRISQAEFKVFQANNPNLSTDPDAIRKIFDFNTRLYNRDLSEQQALQDYTAKGGNPAGFSPYWSHELARRGYTDPSLSASGSHPADALINKYLPPGAK